MESGRKELDSIQCHKSTVVGARGLMIMVLVTLLCASYIIKRFLAKQKCMALVVFSLQSHRWLLMLLNLEVRY